MNVNEFDFELPERLIAQTPLADRTAGARRLLRYQCRCLAGQIGGWLGALGVLFIF